MSACSVPNEAAEVRRPSITRCAACGRRVRSACSFHGAVREVSRDLPPWPSEVASPHITGYFNLCPLGQGGFGTVFQATPVAGGPLVAIKLAREDRADAPRQLAEELRVLSEIGPPHVPAVLAEGRTEVGTPYFVMEHLGEAPLAARLVGDPEPFSVAEAVQIGMAIAGALEAVHGHGYVHRDLKPENVFAGVGMAATLIDFGLAAGFPAIVEDSIDGTTEGPTVGTVEYMSPEQCEGRLDLDVRTDIYALGVLLQEMVTGRPPFWGPRVPVQEMHVSHRPPRLSAVVPRRAIPVSLEETVLRCLAKDRRERFASAQDLRRALAEAHAEIAGGMAPRVVSVPRVVGVAPPASAPAPAAAPSPLLVGAVLFAPTADLTTIQARLRAFGGEIAYGAAERYAAVFARETPESAVRSALHAAGDLVRSGLCAQARVDLVPVVVQARKDGMRRFLSHLFARKEQYPGPHDPQLHVAPAAQALVQNLDMVPASIPSTDPGSDPTPTSLNLREAALAAARPLVGRDDLLACLLRSAEEVVTGSPPAVVTVAGEPGMGKSHLFRELAERLASFQPRAALLTLHAVEPSPGDAEGVLVELLRWGLDVAPSAAPRGRGMGDRNAWIAAALGKEAPAALRSGEGSAVHRVRAAPGALRSTLTATAGEALRRKASGKPLLVLLDDAQFADDVALAALEYATLPDAGAPIWICALARPAFLEEHPGWGERAGRSERHVLAPLDAESAESLCRSLLAPAESVPARAVQQLVASARGTPLLLVELVRAIHREGMIRRSPKGEGWYLAADEIDRLPALPLVEWLAQREVDAFAPALQGHARLLALLGDAVTEAEVAGVLSRIEPGAVGVDLPLDARVGTRRLVSAGLLVRGRDARLFHRHALFRAALARGASAPFRQAVHLAAASYYRTAGTLDDDRRLAQLAVHASEAGLAEEAAASFFLLAERARAWHAYLDAERLYSRVLDQPDLATVDRAAAYRGRALMRYRLARYHDALTDFSAVRLFAEAQGDVVARIDTLLEEATVHDWMDDFATSEARVRDAQACMPDDAPPVLRARLLLGLGRSAMRWNRHEEAAHLLAEAAHAAEPLGDDAYETRVISLLLLGFLLPGLNRENEARQALEQTVALAEAHADLLHLGGALNTRALLWGRAGDKERMVADMTRSLAIARDLGQGSLELMGEFNLGELLLQMDDPVAATPHVERCRAIDRRVTGHPGRAVVALLEARLKLHQGDLQGARAIVRDIRARQVEARACGEPDTIMVPADDVLCSAVELSVEGGTSTQWDALEVRSAEVSFGQERIEIIEARAALATRMGRREEARGHLVRAMDLARKLPNAMAGRLARRLGELDSLPV